MNIYTPGVLMRHKLDPASMRASGLLGPEKVTSEEWLERGANVMVKRKQPGNLVFLFVVDSRLDEYLRVWKELTERRNACAQKGVAFTLPSLSRTVEEIATEDFARSHQNWELDTAAWVKPPICECSQIDIGREANQRQTYKVSGYRGGAAKRWTLNLDPQNREAMRLHAKPL